MTRIEQGNRYGRVDPAALGHLEAWIGGPLPDSYRAFLLEHNGGVPVPAVFDGGIVECFLALHDQVWDEDSPGGAHGFPLQSAVLEWRDSLPERDDVPVGRSTDGRWITVAIEGDRRGTVRCVDPESDDEAPVCAVDFDTFLSGLGDAGGDGDQ